jgi:hypothetical protein
MAAVRSDLYIALTKAGVPEETDGKLAAADAKFEVEEMLIAVLEPSARCANASRPWIREYARCWRRTRQRTMTIVTVRRVLILCADRGGGPGQRRYNVEQVLNSIEYHPSDYLTPDEVLVSCRALAENVQMGFN